MKKFFKNLAMACLAALSCVAIGLGTGCEAVNSVLGTFESLGGHIGNVIDKVTHECEYNVMKHDADNHWNECECGEKDETSVAAHVYDNACDTTCNVCGAERNVADHVYDNACDTTCNVCGAERKVADHVYDNACDTTCNVCGAERKVADHVYDNACDADCNVCGATRTPADHVYDNACDADCNVCGATRKPADHVYDNACDTTCNVCGAERAITHDYSKYDSDATKHWKVCSVCGVKEEGSEAAHTGGEATATEQAICDVCKAPYGETLPYVTAALMLDGDATNVTIPAGKYAQVSVNTMFETIVLEFSENVTVTVDDEEVESGAIVEYNYRTSIVVTPVDATAETAATLSAAKYVSPATILSVGDNEVTVNGQQAFVPDIEVGKAYDLTIDDTLYVVAEYSNGVTDSYVVTGYVLKLEKDVSVTLLISSSDWFSSEASGTITISEHTTHTYVWMKDLNNHWQGCGCGVVVDGTTAAHTYDYECSDTCNVCGSYRFNAADHDYTVVGHDKDVHWKECVCGTRDSSSYEAHYGGEATATEQAKCEVCGQPYGDTLTCTFLKLYANYGTQTLQIPEDKYAMVTIPVYGESELQIIFSDNVQVYFGGQPLTSGDVITLNKMENVLKVVAIDNSVDTEATMSAITPEIPTPELSLGETEVSASYNGNEYTFAAKVAGTYVITFTDANAFVMVETADGAEQISSGYEFTLAEREVITFVMSTSDWSNATYTVTIAVKEEVASNVLTGGTQEVKATQEGTAYTFTAKLDNTYVLTFDDTALYITAEYGNVSDMGISSGYEFTLASGETITFIIMPYDLLAASATGEVTLAEKTAEEHTHSYTTLKSDADNHWYECECGAKTEAVAHDYSKYASDETNHWKVCSVCSVKDESTVASHTGGTATCTAQAVCEVCGKAYGELAAHTPAEDDGDCTTAVKCTVCDAVVVEAKESHTGGEATCTAQAVCEVCGTAYGDLAAHTPAADDGDCTTAVKCTVCDAVVVEAKEAHTGGKATCTAKAVCEVCGTAYGELADHTYTNKYDTVCDVCEAEREVTLTVAEAIELGNTKDSGKYTTEKYTVSGKITLITNTTSGSVYITDETGTMLVYGICDSEGNKYGTLENKPVLGDVVTLHSIVGKYNKNPQLKDATLVKFTKGAAAEELTLTKASELGKAQENDLYTTDLYIVSGVITEVKNTQYGNVYITDGTNTFFVYGIYGETGTYFDKLSPVPLAGDTIKVVGVVGNHNGAEQMKNATLLAHTVSDANKVKADAAALKLSAAQLTEVGASIDLATAGANGSTITWALKAECANVSLADGKLTVVSLPTEDVEVVLVATLTLNDASTTKELTVTVLKSGSVVEQTADYTLSFASTDNRTEFSTKKQVWEQKGVTFTNDKAGSSNNVADYSKPVRLYAKSSVTIACTGMKKIVFNCNSSSYATALKNSISGVTVSVNGKVVTVEFTEATDSLKITLGAQVRLDSIVVTAVVGA